MNLKTHDKLDARIKAVHALWAFYAREYTHTYGPMTMPVFVALYDKAEREVK